MTKRVEKIEKQMMRHFEMERQQKRPYVRSTQMAAKKILNPSFDAEPTKSNYMNRIGEEMENILTASTQQQQYTTSNDEIKNSLPQLGNDVTDIKSTLEKKKPKVTLFEIDEKLNYIIQILQNEQQTN